MSRAFLVTALAAAFIASSSGANAVANGHDESSLYRNPASLELDTTEKMKGPTPPCTDIDQCSFVEKFKYKDTYRWAFANDYANGRSFAAWWSKNRVFFNKNTKMMEIKMGRNYRHGKSYVSGQMQSKRWHGYGCYEVRMKPANQEGLISTFFSYTGKYDAAPGKPKKHNEVDVEFVYKRKYKKIMLQANYFTNGKGGNERIIKLPFDPVKKMNNYGFKWTSKKITWYVNGKKMYSSKKDIPQISQGPLKIMMSLWPVSEHAAGWGGYYHWTGQKSASYAAMRFTRGENCKIHNYF